MLVCHMHVQVNLLNHRMFLVIFVHDHHAITPSHTLVPVVSSSCVHARDSMLELELDVDVDVMVEMGFLT